MPVAVVADRLDHHNSSIKRLLGRPGLCPYTPSLLGKRAQEALLSSPIWPESNAEFSEEKS
jgi:hypothetical protein